MTISRQRQVAALAAGLLAASVADAQLFKCVTREGKTVYQDSKCDDAATQSTVRAPTPGAEPAPAAAPQKPGASAPAAPAAPPASGNTVEIVAGYAICAERVPNFARKHSEAYEGWKQRNAEGLNRLSSEPDASRLDERMRTERERPASESMAERCADVATSIQAPRAAAK